ncbi:MAG: ATP-binding protein [Woeseiaceae bacterium]
MNKEFSSTPFVLRYVFAILTIIAISVAIVLVSLYSAQQRELESRDRIQFLHLDAVAESAELARETRTLRQRVHDDITSSVSHSSGAAGITSVQIGYSGILQSMRSRLRKMSLLEEQNDDEILSSTMNRLISRFEQVDRALRFSPLNAEILTSIDVLSTTNEQYDRLHQIAADQELIELAGRQQARPFSLGFLLVCLGLGGLTAGYLVLSLRTSLKKQEVAETALADSQERLLHIQKVDALGRLVGGIAHDFNNWLTVILGHAGLLRDIADSDERLKTGLHEIEQAGLQAATFTKQLVAYSRRQKIQPRVFNLNELIQDLEEVLQRVVGKDIRLTTSYADDLFSVELDPDQVQLVILNLVNNARDAMPDGGLLSVTTERISIGPTGTEIDEVPEGEYITLSITDTGTGMDDDTRERVFEPLFTTKEKGQGTGLGLSTVYGIVAAADGHIFVESREGAGSKFVIYFPRVEQRQTEVSEATAKAAPQEGVECVLVVEDNEQVRRFVETGLATLGYRVLTASGGAGGLEICRTEPGGIDVIVSDVVMPATSGPKFMDTALKLRPDAVAIYMSAYSKDEVLRFRRNRATPDIPLIPKPFEIEALSRLIREQLDEKTQV